MQRLFAFILIVGILSGCCCWQVTRVSMDIDTLAYSREISRVVLHYADELKDDHVFLHSSYAYFDEEAGKFKVWLDFNSQKLLDVDGGRRLVVKTVEGLVERLNSSPGVLLADPIGEPLTYENIYLSVELESFFGVYVDPLYLGRVELQDGYVTATYAHTALNRRTCVFHQHFEPFETSQFIVAVQDQIAAEKRPERAKEKTNDQNEQFHEILKEVPSDKQPPRRIGGWVE